MPSVQVKRSESSQKNENVDGAKARVSTPIVSDWDPNDATSERPKWKPSEVRDMLRGLRFERAHHLAKSPHSGVTNVFQELRFGCGCLGSDHRGWEACPRPFHELLQRGTYAHPATKHFRRLRALFDQLLAEVWHRRGRADPDFLENIRMVRGTTMEDWRTAHDLVDRSIWQEDGFLSADLETIPGVARITLYNGGSEWHPELLLQLPV